MLWSIAQYTVFYNQQFMRNHLLDCLMNNLLLYTATAILRCPISEVKIDVFCNCRLPQGAIRIAECDQFNGVNGFMTHVRRFQVLFGKKMECFFLQTLPSRVVVNQSHALFVGHLISYDVVNVISVYSLLPNCIMYSWAAYAYVGEREREGISIYIFLHGVNYGRGTIDPRI